MTRWACNTLLMIVISSFLGCAGPSVLLQGEDRLVRYEQFDRKTGDLELELVLVEKRDGRYGEVYSEERNKANVKLVPAPMFEDLVRSLEDLDFVEMAKRRKPDVDARRRGVTRVISVENDRGIWCCTNSTDLPCDENYVDEDHFFGAMDQVVRDYFNHVLALQSVTNDEGGELFYKEQQRLKEEIENPHVKLERVQ